MEEPEASSPQKDDPEAPLYSTVPLEDEDGNEYVIQQQNVGREDMEGGGEWPDPHTPPRAPAPGSAASTSDKKPIEESGPVHTAGRDAAPEREDTT